MVAPIALFPDKLVALVLAGATYPDQVTAANNWVRAISTYCPDVVVIQYYSKTYEFVAGTCVA
jgi:hypothetical protein